MKSNKEIRNDFFEFFKSKKHKIVSSAPLLPAGDKTLLFTNAGMNQFKDMFLGTGKRDYKRAADTQKCMRVSGKHNDFDDVGKDTYHHTFFEMLGNWSFGDYYKEEAIVWAWELLTDVWKLPKDKLYATVYKDDDEAFDLWKEKTDIDQMHILKFGDKDNFWEMGETGPCGPCSEIHIDMGEDLCKDYDHKGKDCWVNSGCPRYIELWNLVFIQYNRKLDRTLEDLPKKHIDTGMGFERIVSVIQGKTSNYDTDLFTPITAKLEELSGKKFDSEYKVAMQVISDHIRSLFFAVSDGIMPSNEGRGYVLRRILRRALRFGQTLGFEKPFLIQLLPVLIDVMGETFGDLEKNTKRITEVINHEEDRFFSTLESGMSELSSIIKNIRKEGKNKLPGEVIFRLYDSLGFPVEICEEVAKEEEIEFDHEGFDKLMHDQKNRGKKSWKGAQADDFSFLKKDSEESKYIGEENHECKANIVSLFDKSGLLSTVDAGKTAYTIFNQTPFYAESGGQTADTGFLTWENGRAEVTDVFKKDKQIIHELKVAEGSLEKDAQVTLSVDFSHKRSIARNHTATHLLHQALSDVVGDHVAQAGSLVDGDRLRFDFTHFGAISRDILDNVEQIVNQKILNNINLDISYKNKDDAVKAGAKALFGEKYEDNVRVVKIGEYSTELCGGTHVESTGDIGLFKIISESSIASGVRRIEALTGSSAIAFFQKIHNTTIKLGDNLNIPIDKLEERVASLNDKLRKLEKAKSKEQSSQNLSSISDLEKSAEKINGYNLIISRVDNPDAGVLKMAIDNFKNKLGDCVVLLGGESKGKCLFVLGASKKAVDAGFDAKTLINKIAGIAGGGGGGRPDLAQAGGKDPDKIDEALDKGKTIIKDAIS